MTNNEQTISNLKKLKSFHNGNYGTDIDKAIKVSEQETCNDCISRQAVLDLINADWKYENLEQPVSILPPVTPQPKIGRWILSGGYWRCSECKEKALLKLDKATGNCREYTPIRSNFCPNCGAKMVDPQESEDKTN